MPNRSPERNRYPGRVCSLAEQARNNKDDRRKQCLNKIAKNYNIYKCNHCVVAKYQKTINCSYCGINHHHLCICSLIPFDSIRASVVLTVVPKASDFRIFFLSCTTKMMS